MNGDVVEHSISTLPEQMIELERETGVEPTRSLWLLPLSLGSKGSNRRK